MDLDCWQYSTHAQRNKGDLDGAIAELREAQRQVSEEIPEEGTLSDVKLVCVWQGAV
jgi:hypothetical protein